MREIVVISGKGGTGKTSVCASLAHLAQNKVVCDLDVDAPDMHILLDPQVHTREAFVSGNEAVIDRDACRRCGICFEHCRFDAVKKDGDVYGIDPLRCEGCGVCVALCPAKAIAFPEKECGEWYVSDTRFGPFVHAQLYPGQENSGRLVTLLKQQARELAKRQGLDLVICDGSPGVDARSSARLRGEPRRLWWSPRLRRHDFERVAALCDHFRIPVAVLINKADLNHEEVQAITPACRRQGLHRRGSTAL